MEQEQMMQDQAKKAALMRDGDDGEPDQDDVGADDDMRPGMVHN